MRSKEQVKAISDEVASTVKEAHKKLSMTVDGNRDAYILLSGVLDTEEKRMFLTGEISGNGDNIRGILEGAMTRDEALLHTVMEAVGNVLSRSEGKNANKRGIIIGGSNLPSFVKDILEEIFEAEREMDEPKEKKPFDPKNPNIN